MTILIDLLLLMICFVMAVWVVVGTLIFTFLVLMPCRNPWTGEVDQEPTPWLGFLKLAVGWPLAAAYLLIWGHPDP